MGDEPAANSAFDLQGRVAVVTGASSGLGRSIACELAAAGADVVVHFRANRDGAEETARMIRQSGRDTLVVSADVADEAACRALVEAAWGWRGRVDAWINNAGADVLTGEARQWSFEQKLARLWQVDVQGTTTLTRLAGARMSAGGAICNIGWDQAEQGMAGDAGQMFGTIKGAVMAYTRAAAQSLAPAVRVNCVAPGWIRTAWGREASEYWQRRAIGESLLGRWGEVEDVARAVRFLVSPAASFITGAVLPVNGGFRYGLSESQ